MNATAREPGSYSGMPLDLGDGAFVRLERLLQHNAETDIYRTDHPEIVVKLFDLRCGKADEISYGPYVSFALELAHFEDVNHFPELAPYVPAYYGAAADYEKKFAFIAMEFIHGQDLMAWSRHAAATLDPAAYAREFRHTAHEALAIIELFHRHGLILVDFKPENAIRSDDGRVRFVDLGAFFTNRYRGENEKYVYSATPDHAEVLIDACNIETGHPLTDASDIFSSGVALFEMASSFSRLQIENHTADEILAHKEIYLFRDTQIRDVWKAYPHLKELLPTVETQLQERKLLFADFWHVLKSYVTEKIDNWESLAEAQQEQVMMATGTTFILEQLPSSLQWLAGPIAQATTLRSLRLPTIGHLKSLLAEPVPEDVRENLINQNSLLLLVRQTDPTLNCMRHLNAWDLRPDPRGQWAVNGPVACALLPDAGEFTFLKCVSRSEPNHRFYALSGDLDADDTDTGKLTASSLKTDRSAWLI